MTEEEKQELETLRQEKRRQTQESRARAALERGGIPPAFAPLLAGESDEETDEKAALFQTAYQTALAEDLRARLPQRPPVVTAPVQTLRPSRGVRRIR